jgi:hypothetical protein
MTDLFLFTIVKISNPTFDGQNSDRAVANYHIIGFSVWRFLSEPAFGWLHSKEVTVLASKDYESAAVTSNSEFLRRLVAGFPPRRPGFKSGSGHVGFCDGQKWR